MIIDEEEHALMHYGILRRSGRYPWGSGGNEHARSKSFFDHVASLKKEGLSDTEIAKGFGMSTSEFRDTKTIAKNAMKGADIARAERLAATGMSNIAIGKEMGRNESSVRALLAPGQAAKTDQLKLMSNMLRDQVAKKEFVDVGANVERQLGVSKEKLGTAVSILKDEGYALHNVQVDQLGTSLGKKTIVKVLAPPGTTYRDIVTQQHKIQQIREFSDDGGYTLLGIKPPLSISSKRIAVRYAEEGGKAADGVIYVRPGVKDVSLGGSNYAQVRIAVDGTHYLKGMAMYRDDLPPGVDLMFNTNKSKNGSKLNAMKPMTDDPDNPFGSNIRRQIIEKHPKTGVERVTSAMNIVNEEGKWETWNNELSSQMLSKQPPTLAKEQLGLKYQHSKDELHEIMGLTNPAVRKRLLESYADGVDSAAVGLEAAALPRTRNHVILPIPSMKENEVYAPNFRNGERVVLIRHPHGGPFEIPELTVNNRNREAKKLLGPETRDAIGINHKVAERLSGADFDGDTVLVIPNDRGKIKTAPALAGLKNFDAQRAYPAYPGMKRMTDTEKGFAMGDVSNLITDMTIKGANNVELAAAVRHSMVVIDAEKHGLNWKQSAIDNNIAHLKKKYQTTEGKNSLGAATLISRATSRQDVLARRGRPAKRGGPVDPATGRKVFENTNESWVDAKTGKVKFRKQISQKLAETENAHTLSSGTDIEKVYADHSNMMKALGNEARKAAVNTRSTPVSNSAKVVYKKEVDSLNAKLNVALMNSPLERQAQLFGNATLAAKRAANPNMTPEEVKKIRFQALDEARRRVGAKKVPVEIEPREWDAIQAGAITSHKLSQILNNTNIDVVKKLATPKPNTVMTTAKQAQAKALLATGNYTLSEIADHLGVALSTLKSDIAREDG